jgi:hypothetical protein
VSIEESINQLSIQDRALYKNRAAWDIVFKAAAQIVKNDNLVAPTEKFVSNMRSYKAGASGNQ